MARRDLKSKLERQTHCYRDDHEHLWLLAFELGDLWLLVCECNILEVFELTDISYVGGSAAWRVPLAFQFLFIIILFATVPWLPESPRWLMAKGRIEEAEKILADLEAKDVDDPFIIAQSKDIQWAVQYEKDHAVRWRDLLRGRTGDQAGTHTIRRLFLGMGTQAMQQLCKSIIALSRLHKAHLLSSRHQCHILLLTNSLDPVCRSYQQFGTPASCV
jgi:hypothetical protein